MLCIFLLFLIAGCEGKNESSKIIRIKEDFRGEVTEINLNAFLIEYDVDKYISLTADNTVLEELTIGDTVIVEIDGGVDESIPLLSSAKSVYIIEKGFSYKNKKN
ncbi:DUF3221 domain-containing protein [Psychrobacillus sp. NPDC058041]|uniref:DUF3221 domain-containing protein n=1 Tax=Psychrobacillus sp. NPDC058041 TaxID=3346310 RepID=UPI0036D99ADB